MSNARSTCTLSTTRIISKSSRPGRKSGSTSSNAIRPMRSSSPIMAAAHAYQISSARDELPAQFHANKELLGARAEPPDRVDRRRRLRHRQRQGLHRRRRAGRQPDRRQRRRGRGARARHDADAVEAGRPGQQRAPQGHDEGPQPLHGQRHQQQDDRHRRAWQRRPPPRQALRDRVRHEGAGLRSVARREDHRRAQRHQGRARRIDAALRLRLDQLPARRHARAT